jgi:hypothetical protein
MKRRAFLSVGTLVAAVILMGAAAACRSARTGPVNGLRAEDARRALVAMVENGDDRLLKMGLENLKTDPIRRVGSHVEIGVWHVDLDDRKWVLSIVRPPMFTEYAGEFSRGPGGRWVATGRVSRQS